MLFRSLVNDIREVRPEPPQHSADVVGDGQGHQRVEGHLPGPGVLDEAAFLQPEVGPGQAVLKLP